MLKLYNSLTREIENFVPERAPNVTMYTCGPTVYQFATIGNFRTYTMADVLVRTLELNNYTVKYIMNLTDVGHLTGDNLGDADTGEDRMEKSAQKEGKTAWEVAQFYTDAFLEDFDALHITRPELFAKATEHIKEQIELIEKLQKKGFTYVTSDGVYFNTEKFPQYGLLSNLDQIKEGARVEINKEKKNPRDFALWKFSPVNEQRQMEWDSPWGIGFPGWHIECSAMSMKYLGETIDIHTGGMDLRETHHPNEIAQSEAATGKKFVNYWMHTTFLLVNGEKMSKSKGNAYRVYDLEKEEYQPLSLRYLYLQTHYRQEMNFTFSGLDAAQNAVKHLQDEMMKLVLPDELPTSLIVETDLEKKFQSALNNDLNTPEALAVVWELLKSDEKPQIKLKGLFLMDTVLGLDLKAYYEKKSKEQPAEVPDEVMALAKERYNLREAHHYTQADQLRNKIKKLGYDVDDIGKKFIIKKL